MYPLKDTTPFNYFPQNIILRSLAILGVGLHIQAPTRFVFQTVSPLGLYVRQNILFLLIPPTNFEQDWVLYTVICFHIMTKKTIGLVKLNLQWELYFFTHLFSSTGLWCLLVLGLGLQFNINEICMLYLLVSNPCILSSGYNVSVKKTTLHLLHVLENRCSIQLS